MLCCYWYIRITVWLFVVIMRYIMIRAKLIEAREKSNLTQEKLAEALKVEVSTIQRWEAGETTPQGRNKCKLIAFFGVPSEYDLDLRRHSEKAEKSAALASVMKRGFVVRLVA